MNYSKKPHTFEQQADILLKRGILTERDDLIETLKHINYYRITGYLYPFRISESENFAEGTSLEKVLDLYSFDKALRLIVLEGLEMIEVSILRTQIVELLTTEKGLECYLQRDIYTRGARADRFHNEISRKSQEIFDGPDSDIKRFKKKYSDSKTLPFWIVVEKYSFGTMTHLYKNILDIYRRAISKRMNIPPVVLESWMHLLNRTRNYCAHHARLWNRNFFYLPNFPFRHINDLLEDVAKEANNHEFTKMFSVLSIMLFLINFIEVSGGWKSDLIALLEASPESSLQHMGFP